MDFVHLVVGEVTYCDVAVPHRFSERWRGLKSQRGAMVFRARSVHGFGMDRSLIVVAIDWQGRVIDVSTLRPSRVYFNPAARFVLELDTLLESPQVGAVVRLYDHCHGGTSRGLRNTHRQPRRHFGAPRRDTAKR